MPKEIDAAIRYSESLDWEVPKYIRIRKDTIPVDSIRLAITCIKRCAETVPFGTIDETIAIGKLESLIKIVEG